MLEFRGCLRKGNRYGLIGLTAAIFYRGREAAVSAVPFGDAVRSLSMPSRKTKNADGAVILT
jgi:hypothetical protein